MTAEAKPATTSRAARDADVVPQTSIESSSHITTLPDLPELFNRNFLDVLAPARDGSSTKPKKDAGDAPAHAFMTALRNDAGNRTLTENASPAFKSTLNAPLDFFSVSANAPGSDIFSLLDKSWAEDPELTLRLIFCLRSIHDGKGEKVSFYHAYGWLYSKHPRTAIANIALLVAPIIDPPTKAKNLDEGGSEGDGEDWEEVRSDTQAEEEKISYKLSHGYYKDLLNILTLANAGELTDPSSTFQTLYSERPAWTYGEGKAPKNKKNVVAASPQSSTVAKEKKISKPKLTKEERKARPKKVQKTRTEISSEEASAAYATLVRNLAEDRTFLALYVAVARLFAEKLSEEVKILEKLTGTNAASMSESEKRILSAQIGLVAKWAPTLGASHDRRTNIATAIALVMHRSGDMADLRLEYNGSAAHVAKIRSFYRRWIVAPLRRHLEVPEIAMSANEWQRIRYSRVPAICMSNSKTFFFRHDHDGFVKYLEAVTEGKRKIAGATLMPHELVLEVVRQTSRIDQQDDNAVKAEARINLQVAEAQWNALVDRLRESGALDNCMAVCDVSGSMGSIQYTATQKGNRQPTPPIVPAIALSLLVSKLAKPPFADVFVTFSAQPEIMQLDGEGPLAESINKMSTSSWGMNTDFNAVFLKLILPLAQKHKIPKDQMVKTLFVFSDMQFDQAGTSSVDKWETNHEGIVKAYKKAGYDVPEIVYWNLSGNARASKPVTAETPGVAMLSGFSANLLKTFMDGGTEALLQEIEEKFEVLNVSGEETAAKEKKPGMDPVAVMIKAVSRKSFEALRVLD